MASIQKTNYRRNKLQNILFEISLEASIPGGGARYEQGSYHFYVIGKQIEESCYCEYSLTIASCIKQLRSTMNNQ